MPALGSGLWVQLPSRGMALQFIVVVSLMHGHAAWHAGHASHQSSEGYPMYICTLCTSMYPVYLPYVHICTYIPYVPYLCTYVSCVYPMYVPYVHMCTLCTYVYICMSAVMVTVGTDFLGYNCLVVYAGSIIVVIIFLLMLLNLKWVHGASQGTPVPSGVPPWPTRSHRVSS